MVDIEKKGNKTCNEFFKKQYNLQEIEVNGLFVGARGTILILFEDFRKKFKFKKNLVTGTKYF